MRRKVITLLVCLVVIGLGGLGSYWGWRAQKARTAARSLIDGNLAFEEKDWERSRQLLGRYLASHQDDVEILERYAQANLRAWPVEPGRIAQALGAYRQILRLQPDHSAAFSRLALLLEYTGDWVGLQTAAETRLNAVPTDAAAKLAEAKALLLRQKPTEAEAILRTLLEQWHEGTSTPQPFMEACIVLSGMVADKIEPGGNDALERESGAWLDRGRLCDSTSPWPLVRQASLHRLIRQKQNQALDASAIDIIKQVLRNASELPFDDPRARLALAVEYAAISLWDEAKKNLDLAVDSDWRSLEPFIVDPADWTLSCFQLDATIALAVGDDDARSQLADRILADLDDRPQRLLALPTVVQLNLASGRLDQARQVRDKYARLNETETRHPLVGQQLATLNAAIAQAEGDPYRVIAELEPLAERPDFSDALRSSLIEAYASIGQSGRAEQLAKGNPLSEAALRAVVSSHLQRGEWQAAQRMLTEAETDADAPIEIRLLHLTARLGAALSSRGDASGALDDLTDELVEMRDTHTDRVDIRLLLASVLMHRSDSLGAEQELRRAIRQCSQPLSAYLALARWMRQNDDDPQTETLLKEACEKQGDQPAAWLALSSFLREKGRLAEAAEALQSGLKEVEASQGRRSLEIGAALLKILHGEEQQGIESLFALASDDPRDIRVRELLLELPAVRKDAAQAGRIIEEIRTIEGDRGIRWRLHRSRVDLDLPPGQQDVTAISSNLKNCLDADPNWETPALLLGQLYEQRGRLEEAEAVYSAAFRRTRSANVGDRLFILLQKRHRFEEARTVLDQLAEVLNEDALRTRSVSLALSEGDSARALKELETGLASATADPGRLIRLATLRYLENKDPEESLQLLDQALEAGADLATVTQTRVAILLREQRSEEAQKAVDRLVEKQPTASALILRGTLLTSLGDRTSAERDFKEAARVAEDDSGFAALGEHYARAGELDRAMESWESGLQVHRDSTRLRRGLVKAALMRGGEDDLSRADKLLLELEELLPDDAEVIWLQVVRNNKIVPGTNQPGLDNWLQRAVQASAPTAEPFIGLCTEALQREHGAAARDIALRGLELFPTEPRLRLQQARAELMTGNLAAAHDLARKIAAADPLSEEFLAFWIETSIRTQDSASLAEARSQIQNLLQQQPAVESLSLLLARTQAALGDTDAARATLFAWLDRESASDGVAARLMLAELMQSAGDQAGAVEQLRLADAASPSNPAVTRVRMMHMGLMNQFQELVQLAETDPTASGNPELLALAAEWLSTSPDHLAEALRCSERSVAVDPRRPRAQTLLGNLRIQLGQMDAARSAFAEAIRYPGAPAEAFNNLAWLLAQELPVPAQAIEYATTATTMIPNNPDFMDTLGLVLRRSGRLPESRRVYESCLDLKPSPGLRTELLVSLAEVCSELGEREAAQNHARSALELANLENLLTPERRAALEALLIKVS